jgi:hypothetical protein
LIHINYSMTRAAFENDERVAAFNGRIRDTRPEARPGPVLMRGAGQPPYELEARDLTFGLSVRPRQSDCDSGFVLGDAITERGDQTGAGTLDPGCEVGCGLAPDHRVEFCDVSQASTMPRFQPPPLRTQRAGWPLGLSLHELSSWDGIQTSPVGNRPQRPAQDELKRPLHYPIPDRRDQKDADFAPSST